MTEATRARLEREGYTFTWAYSAFRVCVRLEGEWVGTYDTVRAYQIPPFIIETIRQLDAVEARA